MNHLISVLLATSIVQAAEQSKKVLIIGIDGVRSDTWKNTIDNTPNQAFKNLDDEWAWTYSSYVGPVSISGPSWSSMVTGVWCDKHGITDNHFKKKVSGKTMFHHAADKGLHTAAVYVWKPIGDEILGPVDISEVYGTDQEVTDRAKELLDNDANLDILFVALDWPDDVGHRIGFGTPEYNEAVRGAETMANQIIDSLNDRPFIDEDWIIILTSDHGGGGKHKRDHCPSWGKIDKETFMSVKGSNVNPGEIKSDCQVGVVDVAVTALTHLQIPFPQELDGYACSLLRDDHEIRDITCINTQPICVGISDPIHNLGEL